jgi:hypothetical protein
MSSAMFAAAIPPVLMALDRADHLLDRASGTVGLAGLLRARLHPGMMPAAGQLRTVADFALRATLPLCGRPLPDAAFPDEPRGLRARIAFSRATVSAFGPADFTDAHARRIVHLAGEARLDQSADEYLHLFALPNLWFHLSMAYAIFRAEGVPLGKADFDGLHAYGTGRLH